LRSFLPLDVLSCFSLFVASVRLSYCSW